jgi:hypothetical protein
MSYPLLLEHFDIEGGWTIFESEFSVGVGPFDKQPRSKHFDVKSRRFPEVKTEIPA